MVKKYKKKELLRTIDDFIYNVENTQGLSNSEKIDPIEHEFIEEPLEDNKADETEQAEIPNQSYMNNSPSMDDDFLGGFNTTNSILENENFLSHPEENKPLEEETTPKESTDIKSPILKIKRKK